jgi:hypothetical protein
LWCGVTDVCVAGAGVGVLGSDVFPGDEFSSRKTTVRPCDVQGAGFHPVLLAYRTRHTLSERIGRAVLHAWRSVWLCGVDRLRLDV